MEESFPFLTYRTIIEPGWLDYNGHMNEAYYLLIVSRSTDLLLDTIGIDEAYRTATRCSVYTVETHLSYIEEVGEGVHVAVHVRLLGHDAKRLHVWSEMVREESGSALCLAEMVMVHVNTLVPSVSPFPDHVARRVADMHEAQRDLPWPERAGRAIRPVRQPLRQR